MGGAPSPVLAAGAAMLVAFNPRVTKQLRLCLKD